MKNGNKFNVGCKRGRGQRRGMRQAKQVDSSQVIRGFVCHVEEYGLYHKGTREAHECSG